MSIRKFSLKFDKERETGYENLMRNFYSPKNNKKHTNMQLYFDTVYMEFERLLHIFQNDTKLSNLVNTNNTISSNMILFYHYNEISNEIFNIYASRLKMSLIKFKSQLNTTFTNKNKEMFFRVNGLKLDTLNKYLTNLNEWIINKKYYVIFKTQYWNRLQKIYKEVFLKYLHYDSFIRSKHTLVRETFSTFCEGITYFHPRTNKRPIYHRIEDSCGSYNTKKFNI